MCLFKYDRFCMENIVLSCRDEGQSVAGHRINHMEIYAGGLGVVEVTWKQSQGSTATYVNMVLTYSCQSRWNIEL
jgi:hypothetical protein